MENNPVENTQKIVHSGPILGILVIVLVLILAGLYLWGSVLSTQNTPLPEKPVINNEPETPRAETDVKILQTQSASDELSTIDADLSSTNLDSLDADLTAIDAEINTTFGQ